LEIKLLVEVIILQIYKHFNFRLVNGIFQANIELPVGKYEYKFIINGGQYWSCEDSLPKVSNG